LQQNEHAHEKQQQQAPSEHAAEEVALLAETSSSVPAAFSQLKL
jgi:hypothetical protein